MVKELGKSAALFFRGLLHHIQWFLFSAVLGILNLVEIGTGEGVSVPAPVFWSVLAASFLVASVLAYHDLRKATAGTSDVRVAFRRIRDDFAQVRHRILEFDTGNVDRMVEFREDPDRHALPTRGWEGLPELESTLSHEAYDAVRDAYVAIDRFNKTSGGIREFGEAFHTAEVRNAINKAEEALS